MKNVILSLLIFVAAEASAQPVAPISATFVGQNLVDQLDVGRQNYNAELCKRLGVADASCNQNNVCAASFAATGQPATGAYCTSSEAIAAGVKYYGNTTTGLQNFIEAELIKPLIPAFAEAKWLRAKETAAKKCATANTAEKNAISSAFGMADNCGYCDGFQ